MAEPALDRDVVRAFWREKSEQDRNRWTPEEMLAHELDLLRELAPRPRSVLDLGSGHGELSRPVAAGGARLVAVDFAPAFARSFTGAHEHFVASDLADFTSDERFDLVLLFGVVTCIDEADEPPLYRRIAGWLADGGVAVVKNQCATEESFAVSGWSEHLGTEYAGRYPAVPEQLGRLEQVFEHVDVRPYPERFRRWANSRHVAFVCRGARP